MIKIYHIVLKLGNFIAKKHSIELIIANKSIQYDFETGHKLGGPDNKGSLMEIIFNHIKTNYE